MDPVPGHRRAGVPVHPSRSRCRRRRPTSHGGRLHVAPVRGQLRCTRRARDRARHGGPARRRDRTRPGRGTHRAVDRTRVERRPRAFDARLRRSRSLAPPHCRTRSDVDRRRHHLRARRRLLAGGGGHVSGDGACRNASHRCARAPPPGGAPDERSRLPARWTAHGRRRRAIPHRTGEVVRRRWCRHRARHLDRRPPAEDGHALRRSRRTRTARRRPRLPHRDPRDGQPGCAGDDRHVLRHRAATPRRRSPVPHRARRRDGRGPVAPAGRARRRCRGPARFRRARRDERRRSALRRPPLACVRRPRRSGRHARGLERRPLRAAATAVGRDPWPDPAHGCRRGLRARAVGLLRRLARARTRCGAAFAGGQERERGSLTPGKRADFVVLDRADVRRAVLETWIGGTCVFRAGAQ